MEEMSFAEFYWLGLTRILAVMITIVAILFIVVLIIALFNKDSKLREFFREKILLYRVKKYDGYILQEKYNYTTDTATNTITYQEQNDTLTNTLTWVITLAGLTVLTMSSISMWEYKTKRNNEEY
jgi:heme/copper-type cytochrome/quinol oxidase subunit 2